MLNDEIVSVSSTVPGAGVADLDLLAAAPVVPVEEVQLQVVGLAVGQVDVDGEAGGGVPDGGDPVGRAGDLQGAGVGGGGRPGVGRLSAGGDGVVGREAGRAGDDVVALRAVGADPAPLRRRVLLEETRGRRGAADGDAGLRAAEAAGRGGDRLDAGGAEGGVEGALAADEGLAGGQGGRRVRAREGHGAVEVERRLAEGVDGADGERVRDTGRGGRREAGDGELGGGGLVGADVQDVAAGHAALVGVGGGRTAAAVERGAAGEQGDSLGRAAVAGQRAELRVDRVRRWCRPDSRCCRCRCRYTCEPSPIRLFVLPNGLTRPITSPPPLPAISELLRVR